MIHVLKLVSSSQDCIIVNTESYNRNKTWQNLFLKNSMILFLKVRYVFTGSPSSDAIKAKPGIWNWVPRFTIDIERRLF